MNTLSCKAVLAGKAATDTPVTIKGWVRTRRDSKAGISFVNVSDGSTLHPVQVVVPSTLPNYAAEVLHLRVVVPGLRLRGGLNARLHWRARAREVRAERAAVRQVLPDVRVPMPATVQIVRVAPSAGVDDDNLAGCCKAVRDEVAAWLGVDDGPAGPVTWTVGQRRGPWAVEIEIHHGGVR